MQTKNDIHYVRTKQVLKGEITLDPQTTELQEWIKNKYGINVLNIEFDTIDKGEWDRINVIVKTRADHDAMHHNGPGYFGYKREFQDEIVEACVAVFRIGKPLWGKPFKGTNTKKPWVCYHVFDEVAASEANGAIGAETLRKLKTDFADMGIWEIVQFFGANIIFLYTNEQVKNINPERAEQLNRRLYEAIKPFDEFNLTEYSRHTLNFDSKENLDKNYDGNIFDYFR